MIDPVKTVVFAVGIGSYEIGSDWALPNAAEHALAFAVWARERSVPQERIHLFLSTVDHKRLAGKISQLGLTAVPATFAAISNFANNDLTKKDGDLLYIFWAGHGSTSEDGARVLFFEDLTSRNQLPFDLNDFFARLRTSSFEQFTTQIAFVDACANRFEELGFDTSLGQVKASKGRFSHSGIKQMFFLAADSGEQAIAGKFGAAVLKALAESTVGLWPPDQARIVSNIRSEFQESAQHPIQLAWTTAEGDQFCIEKVSGDLPASRYVNAAALARKLPVRAIRRLADIALQYAQLGEDSGRGAKQRGCLYEALCCGTGRAPIALPRTTPRIEMLHLVGAALQWNAEEKLALELDQLDAAAEFNFELERLALIQEVRTLVAQLPTTISELQVEYLRTMSRLSVEEARSEATTIDEMLDELYQVSASREPQRPVWEFLLRLADRFSGQRVLIEAFLSRVAGTSVTLSTLRSELQSEELFVLSINLSPAFTENPAIESIDALLVVAGTSDIKRTFPAQRVATWAAVEAKVSEIVRESREFVLQKRSRNESALLVEFLMPSEFLSQSIESVNVKLGPVSKPLGLLHSVVVRLHERARNRAYAINIEAWEELARRIDRDSKCTVHWMDRTRTQPTIETCSGLVVLKFLPACELLEIVNEGFPFLAWLRSEPVAGDWNAFERQFADWASQYPLRNLAREVRKIRRKNKDLGENLALFWDDPDQIGHWLRFCDVATGGVE